MPIKNTNELSEKEYFALLWEYLKRNKNYESFCDWAATQGGKLYPVKKLSIPEEFGDSQGFGKHPFFTLYNWWGDIRSKTMEKDFAPWWRIFEEIEKHLETVEPYSKTMEKDFNEADASIWGKHNKTLSMEELKEYIKRGNFEPRWNPSLEEYRNEFKQELKERLRFTPGRICLTVRVKRNASFRDIGKEVTAFLRQEFYKARPDWNKYGVWFSRKEAHGAGKGKNCLAISRIRKIDLIRYLKVYDLHKVHKKWCKVAAEVYPKLPFNHRLRINLIKEEKKAHKIIRNIEKGSFPGQY